MFIYCCVFYFSPLDNLEKYYTVMQMIKYVFNMHVIDELVAIAPVVESVKSTSNNFLHTQYICVNSPCWLLY